MDLILLGVSKLFLFDHYIKYCKHNVFVVNSEYKTKSQNISTGSFVAQYTITPSANANKSLIDDADIMTELSNQIKSGHLPAPKLDTHGNPVTYYAVYFPPGISITLQGITSCSAWGFCAYHGTVAASASTSINEYYYGVHPDMQAGSGCDRDCGSGNIFENNCMIATHELTEMITGMLIDISIIYTFYKQFNYSIQL